MLKTACGQLLAAHDHNARLHRAPRGKGTIDGRPRPPTLPAQGSAGRLAADPNPHPGGAARRDGAQGRQPEALAAVEDPLPAEGSDAEGPGAAEEEEAEVQGAAAAEEEEAAAAAGSSRGRALGLRASSLWSARICRGEGLC